MHDVALVEVVYAQAGLVKEPEYLSFTQLFLSLVVEIEIAILCVVKDQVHKRIGLHVIVEFDDVCMV